MLAILILALAPGDLGYQYLLLPYSVDEAIFSRGEPRFIAPIPKTTFSGTSYVAGIKAGKAGGHVRGFYIEGIYLNSGKIEGYDTAGTYIGDFAYHAGAFSGARVFSWRGYTILLGAELLFQSAAGQSAFAGALSIGIGGSIPLMRSEVLWAFQAKHLGYELMPFESVRSRLPAGAEAGAKWISPGKSWELSAGLGSQMDLPVYGTLGGVWWVYGYPIGVAASFNSKTRKLAGEGDILTGLSAGALFRLGTTRLAYSWTPQGLLGDAHRIQIDLGCPR
ncbi:MAG: hypothetical protein ABIM88_05435 [candidate division WOR-3 bacterium]